MPANPDPSFDPAAAAQWLISAVQRLDDAEHEVARLQVEQARTVEDCNRRVADLQQEFARREAGLLGALWRAMGAMPGGSDRELIEAVRLLAHGQQMGSLRASRRITGAPDDRAVHHVDGNPVQQRPVKPLACRPRGELNNGR